MFVVGCECRAAVLGPSCPHLCISGVENQKCTYNPDKLRTTVCPLPISFCVISQGSPALRPNKNHSYEQNKIASQISRCSSDENLLAINMKFSDFPDLKPGPKKSLRYKLDSFWHLLYGIGVFIGITWPEFFLSFKIIGLDSSD